MNDSPILVWMRRDARLGDNPALHHAAVNGRVVWAHVDDPADGRPLGAASKRRLHQALSALPGLTLARGPVEREIPRLAALCGARAIYWNRSADPARRAAEDRVAAFWDGEIKIFDGDELFRPGSVRTKTGGQFQVFTPFWRSALALPAPPTPLPAIDPARLTALPGPALDDLNYFPNPDWGSGFDDFSDVGEAAGLQRLGRFLNAAAADYDQARDLPALDGTSRLSPFLALGEISPRQIWHAAHAAPPGPGRETFLKELGWREFSRHLLVNHPRLPEQPLRPEFARFPWRDDPAGLRAWRKGRTGYPVVDAGMRQLWSTGWMHNRVRMIVASFLIKDLLIHWRNGEEWFWDCLVDADAASNAASWQWAAGCGADAAPFFRIFNPVSQGEKFDPKGDYVRRWVPELAHLPAAAIHKPWTIGGVRGYPAPMVDHAKARNAALAAFKGLRDRAADQPSLF